MNPKVAVIILNWNGWQDTLACLRSLWHNDYGNYRLILVDNASTDDSLTKIDVYCTNELKFASYFTEHLIRNKPIKVVHYTKVDSEPTDRSEKVAQEASDALSLIQNDHNYGFTEGNNIGVSYALNEFDPNYVLLLNNDTVLDKAFLNELVNVAERDRQIGLLQPKILRFEDATIESTGMMCDKLIYSKFRGLYEKDKGQYDNDREEGFFYASGACVMIRKSLLEALSGECFDPSLFAYYEDVDLSWIARLIGLKVVYCPESICYHKGGASFENETPLAVYLSLRNRLRVMIKNYSVRTLIFVLPLTIVLKFSLLAFDGIVKLDSSYFFSFLRALGWNILNLRSALVLRQRIQLMRKLRDTQIMKFMIPYTFGMREAFKAQPRR